MPDKDTVPLSELTPSTGIDSFGGLVNVIVRNAFVFAGVISFILLIYGAFSIIVAAGDTKKLEKARMIMTGAISGLLLVTGSFWIVQILQKVTGIPLLNSGL